MLFASLSIHNFIHSVGADAGFAAIIGLALVVILFFAHARETANVRDQVEDANERIASLQQQLQQVRYQQDNQQRGAATPIVGGMPPVAPRPGGPQTAALRTSAAASAVTPRPAAGLGGAAAGAGATLIPAATEGLGAPSLGSATKLIPTPERLLNGSAGPGGVDGDTVVGASAVTAAGGATASVAPAPSFGGVAPTVGATAAAGATATGSGGSGAGQGGVPRRTAPLPESRSLLEDDAPRRRRWLVVLSSCVALAIVVVIIFVAVSGSGNGKSAANHHTTSTGHSDKTDKTPVLDTSKYHVAVLNGTAVSGLAADVFKVLGKQGYKQGAITNAATQTEVDSVVYYVHSSDEPAAKQVAAVLGIKESSVKRVTQAALESCATSPSDAKTSCNANVIVSVGQDQASRAQSNTVTAG